MKLIDKKTIVFTGQSGAGKSTLLKLMTKIIYPNKGSIKTDGKLTSLFLFFPFI